MTTNYKDQKMKDHLKSLMQDLTNQFDYDCKRLNKIIDDISNISTIGNNIDYLKRDRLYLNGNFLFDYFKDYVRSLKKVYKERVFNLKFGSLVDKYNTIMTNHILQKKSYRALSDLSCKRKWNKEQYDEFMEIMNKY